MTSLEKFVRANVKLVQFGQELADSIISESSVFALEIHRDELKAIWASIKSLYEKCIDEFSQEVKDKGEPRKAAAEDSSDSEDGNLDIDSINSRYHSSYETYVRSVSKISASIHEKSIATSPSPVASSTSNFHLPPCDTESFRGDYLSWPSFRDMFSAIYVENTNLSKVQKLFHLRKKTEGEAFEIVKKCPLTNQGFDIAWSALKDRFENKRMLVHSQLRILFNLSVITSESSEELKCLQRDINSCISSLKLYDIDISSWDAIFVYICSTRLPRTTLSLWEQSIQVKRNIPKWSDLNTFLSSRFQTLETVSEINKPSISSKSTTSPSITKNARSENYKKINSNHAKVTASSPSCNLCTNENHTIRKCPKFLAMTFDERSTCIRNLNLCFNCFARNHSVKDCKSNHNCVTCHKRHNSLLHRDVLPETISHKSNHIQSTNSPCPPDPSSTSPYRHNTSSSKIQSCFVTHSQYILLGTAVVKINYLGLTYFVRALIDSGSQGTFISDKIFHLLKLPYSKIEAEISGLNGVTSARSKKLATFSISSRFNTDLKVDVKALVVPQLSGSLPSSSISENIFRDLPKLPMADPKFYESSRIDLLIGADVFNQILLEDVKRNICGSLVAQETIFGYIITGAVPSIHPVSSFSTVVSISSDDDLEKQLKRFWEVENVPYKTMMSTSDELCEQMFTKTTKRNQEGRFIVSLPFKEPCSDSSLRLGSSRASAYAQFIKNESRLLKNLDQKSIYDSVLKEYLQFGHMERVSPPIPQKYPSHYYLPHHAVTKPESTTTKTRVVFNASCPTSSGLSLNDILHTGPALQNDIIILILRWRLFRYVFSADIEKMYRQILVHPKDTCYQRILFRSSPHGEVDDYELKTVTFGVNAAPYLAIRTLLQLADDCKDSHPIASEIIKSSMYVDDILAGSHDIKTALEARNQIISALASACFPLRKWTSNSTAILQGLPKEYILKENFLSFDDSSQTKTLGVRWNAKSDKFVFVSNMLIHKSKYTKREILSEIAKIYDPAGWLAPIVVLAKILMRRIWLSKVGWDDLIPDDCLQDWVAFLNEYSEIDSIQIPRWTSYSPSCRIQFHAFCDASENAYATAIYIRVVMENNTICVNLLASKSRVSPVKTLSIPKLELCGATLLAETVDSIIPSLKISNFELFKWTDSTIVLAWLRRPPCSWKIFVANRVSLISSKIGVNNWFHVESKSNPSDLASRGVYPQELIQNSLWWHGPQWLQQPSECWPISKNTSFDTELECKVVSVNMAVLPESTDILERFSSFSRAIKVLCYVFRFIHLTSPNYRSIHNYSSLTLTADEVSAVTNKLVNQAQQRAFADTYQALLQNLTIPKSSSILNLNPFLDQEGIIRSSGRLTHSPILSYSEKYPIILPYSCQYSRLLVSFIHKISLHGGNQLVVNLVRTQYWIPMLRKLVKTVIHNCKICVLYKKKVQSQLMAALPPERTSFHRPFHITGIDFAGPFDLLSFVGRGSKLTKGYVCIFVCFTTKAIHLEATSSLSTVSFLAAFQRFVSRRGCPLHIYSDNGTNFVGASKEISKDFIKVSRNNLLSQFVQQKISWHFIPPGAPHMGGLWEAGVKSFKAHFKRVSGGFKYSFEEFSTLLSKIEACLNSRPISPISENLSDLNALTPGHFLTGGPILCAPEPNYEDRPESILNRWQRVKVLQQHFCQRWKTEYLKELHKRNKWKNPQSNINVDSIVIIREENLPPNEWKLGRVIRLFPGKDNRVRVAEVLTQKGTLTRPIVKLVLLPSH